MISESVDPIQTTKRRNNRTTLETSHGQNGADEGKGETCTALLRRRMHPKETTSNITFEIYQRSYLNRHNEALPSTTLDSSSSKVSVAATEIECSNQGSNDNHSFLSTADCAHTLTKKKKEKKTAAAVVNDSERRLAPRAANAAAGLSAAGAVVGSEAERFGVGRPLTAAVAVRTKRISRAVCNDDDDDNDDDDNDDDDNDDDDNDDDDNDDSDIERAGGDGSGDSETKTSRWQLLYGRDARRNECDDNDNDNDKDYIAACADAMSVLGKWEEENEEEEKDICDVEKNGYDHNIDAAIPVQLSESSNSLSLDVDATVCTSDDIDAYTTTDYFDSFQRTADNKAAVAAKVKKFISIRHNKRGSESLLSLFDQEDNVAVAAIKAATAERTDPFAVFSNAHFASGTNSECVEINVEDCNGYEEDYNLWDDESTMINESTSSDLKRFIDRFKNRLTLGERHCKRVPPPLPPPSIGANADTCIDSIALHDACNESIRPKDLDLSFTCSLYEDDKDHQSLFSTLNPSQFFPKREKNDATAADDDNDDDDEGISVCSINKTTEPILDPTQKYQPKHILKKSASIVRHRQRRDLLRKYFGLLSDFSEQASQRRLQKTKGLIQKRTDRQKRKVVYSWWEFVRRNKASQQHIQNRFQLRRLRFAFLRWWKAAATEKERLLFLTREANSRLKARTLRRWRRSIRALQSEREAARNSARRAEEERKDATAQEFFRGKALTATFVVWRALARLGLNRKAVERRRLWRKELVKGLFDRIEESCMEAQKKKGENRGDDDCFDGPTSGVGSCSVDSAKLDQNSRRAGMNQDVPSDDSGKKKAALSYVRSPRLVDCDKENLPNASSSLRRSTNRTTLSKKKALKRCSFPKAKNGGQASGLLPTSPPNAQTETLTRKVHAIPTPSTLRRSSPHGTSHSSPPLALSDMNKRWEERCRIRQALADKHAKERMKRKYEAAEAKRRAEDEEIRLVLEEREKKKEAERLRREELRQMREGLRFAGLHYRIGLMKKSLSTWKTNAHQEVNLRNRKADIFRREFLCHTCVNLWKEFLCRQKLRRQEIEFQQVETAAIHHCRLLQRKILRSWHSRILHIRHDLFDLSSLLHARRTASNIFRRWVYAYIGEIDRLRDLEDMADTYRRNRTKQMALREWRERTNERKIERDVEERAEQQWREVRKWLGELTI